MAVPPKRRARGSGTFQHFAFETVYGTPPGGDWDRLPFVSSNLGAEQALIESDLLGQGREPFDPSEDVTNNDGDHVVPVDARFFGHWLTLAFGAPDTAGEDKATGTIVFSGQPGTGSTITVGGQVFTFVATSPDTNEVEKGANLADTLAALKTALNSSVVPGVAAATYDVVGGTTLTIEHDTAGLTGNAFTLASQVSSNGTVSGATLSGGTNAHVFESGGDEMPSCSIELAMEAAQSWRVNYGVKLNTLRIAMSRRGLLNATLGMIAKGEEVFAATQAGTVDAIDPDALFRFSQAVGEVRQGGELLGNVVQAEFGYSNGLDKVETIRPDGEIEGADEGMSTASGNVQMRFAGQDLLDQALLAPVALSFGWARGPHSLVFALPRVFLPRVKKPITGPGGIMATANWQASGQGDNVVTATLVNDVASYALPS